VCSSAIPPQPSAAVCLRAGVATESASSLQNLPQNYPKEHFMTKLRLSSLLLLTAIAGVPIGAAAKPFSQFVEFSGALSDTGNYASDKDDPLPPIFYGHRTANGPVAGELLAAKLGLKAENSMHLIGPPVGTNFAVRDAFAGRNGPHDLPGEYNAYLKSRGGRADPDAFYFIFNGGNDVITAVLTPDDAASDKLLSDAVLGLETAIRTLVNAGAKTIFAPDFVDLSHVPFAAKKDPARAKRISDSYNKQYNAMLDRIEGKLPFELIRWSFDDFFKDLLEHGDEFGLTNVTDGCLAMPKGQCDPDHFLFLTDVFPTAKTHEIMAAAMATAILSRDRDRVH
jgi:phospholipase/lecithinase/hemolysin